MVIDGGPPLRSAPVAECLRELREQHDVFRRRIMREPRGADVLVGALLLPPQLSGNAAGVIFFNNVGYLGMCGHGTIGVAVTLAELGHLAPGRHQLETPAGIVTVQLHDANRVSITNVPSYRYRQQAAVEVNGLGRVHGDIAWGGNWFFLIDDHGLTIELDNVQALIDYTSRVRRALDDSTLRGAGGALIDHIELSGPPTDPERADARNFVLCPGLAYDRSPCGTGTSARLACLIQSGDLQPGDVWRQQSISGSVFEARGILDGEHVVPTITGSAWITARTTLCFNANDPLRDGL